jgi:hypothetical protein
MSRHTKQKQASFLSNSKFQFIKQDKIPILLTTKQQAKTTKDAGSHSTGQAKPII